MSLPNEVVTTLVNVGPALKTGAIVVPSGTGAKEAKTSDITNIFLVARHDAPTNSRFEAVIAGVAKVRLPTGLSPAKSNTVYSSSTAGLGALSGTQALGTIKDATKYSNANPLVTVVLGSIGSGAAGAGETFQIAADDMRVPQVDGWYTLGVAPLNNDFGDRESSLPDRTFEYDSGGNYDPTADPPTAQGAGTQQIEVPSTATQVAITLWHKNNSSAAAGNVGFRLAYIQNPDNAVDSAWLTHDLTDLALPGDNNMQKDTEVITFSSMATPIVPGDLYTFQFVRVAPDSSDLTDSWGLVLVKMAFS